MRAAVSRIAMVKPEKARAIEDMVIQMAQRGQLAAKIGEEQLIDLLSRAGETEEKQRTKVTVRTSALMDGWLCYADGCSQQVRHVQMKRRTYFSDEDEDDDDDF